MLYISTNLGHRECTALKGPTNQIPFDSSVWCWVTPTKGKKILVGCIYRSTSSLGINNDKLMNLLKLANDVAGENRLLILGDFNVPNIDWTNKVNLPMARKLDRDFLEIVADQFLYQHVKEYTRFRGEERSVLDLIFTKEEEDVKNIKVMLPHYGAISRRRFFLFLCISLYLSTYSKVDPISHKLFQYLVIRSSR